MTLYSASCFGGNVYRLFAQMYAAFRMFYGFCVRLCTTFAYVYGFCVHLCAAFAYVYGFSFAHVVRLLRTYTAFVRVERLLRTYTAYLLRTLCSFCVRIRLIFTIFNADSLDGSDLACSSISFFRANSRDSWAVSRYPILRVLLIYFVRASCSWLLDSLKDPILRVPLTSLSKRSARNSTSDLTSEVSLLVLIYQYFPVD